MRPLRGLNWAGSLYVVFLIALGLAIIPVGWRFHPLGRGELLPLLYLGIGTQILALLPVRWTTGARFVYEPTMVAAGLLAPGAGVALIAWLFLFDGTLPDREFPIYRLAARRANLAFSHAAPSILIAMIPLSGILVLPTRAVLYGFLAVVVNYGLSARMVAFASGTTTWDQLRSNFSLEVLRWAAVLALTGGIIFDLLQRPVGFLLAPGLLGLLLAVRANLVYARLSDSDRYLVYSRSVEGVVHNLRNTASSVESALAIIDLTDSTDVVAADLDLARDAVAEMVGSLRNLQSGLNPQPVIADNPVDLAEIADRCALRGSPRAREFGVRLGVNAQPALVRCDPVLLREVVDNLIANALDATPAGGSVVVSTGIRGTRSYLRVSDTGPGIADEFRERLFEPHFTTKPHGTGIGLFTSYAIIREHHGDLVYEGSPGQGCVFTVDLPKA